MIMTDKKREEKMKTGGSEHKVLIRKGISDLFTDIRADLSADTRADLSADTRADLSADIRADQKCLRA